MAAGHANGTPTQPVSSHDRCNRCIQRIVRPQGDALTLRPGLAQCTDTLVDPATEVFLSRRIGCLSTRNAACGNTSINSASLDAASRE